MPKTKRRGQHGKIESLSSDHFTFRKADSYHGFPQAPTAISFEPDSQLLAIGTKNGEFRIYGRPGVVFQSSSKNKAAINEIFSFSGLPMFITVSDDNSVVLWEIESEGQSSLTAMKEFNLDPDGGKKITKCCLSQHSGHFYIGTEGGNTFILDIKLFQLTTEVIYWNQATALVQPTAKNNPGMVKCLELSPVDQNLILIGYEKGVIVLWDLDRGLPSKNYPTNIQDCQQPIESLSWQHEGMKFLSSHSDSSLYYWSITNSTPHEGPTRYYDPGDGNCNPVTKVKWLNTDASPLIICCGGLPVDQEDDHHTVTVVHGADHIALDFSSPVMDFVSIVDPSTQRGRALLVLCEQELMAFDLEAPKCPQIRMPYLFSIHASPVTCIKLYDNCSKDVFEALHEANITSPPPHEHFSLVQWPAMGGCVLASEPATFDIVITGHENGTVKFWDATIGSMRNIHELKTANLFVGQEPEMHAMDEEFSDFTWPPFRKVSTYDPFEDDPRLAIKLIEFCPHSKTLCVGGNGGQAITFSLNPLPTEIHLECIKAEIFLGPDLPHERRGGLRATNALECKTDPIHLPAGFQANFCLQCIPASSITAIAFRPSWGLVAAGINKGFAVGNFLVKRLVLLHPTVQPDGIGPRSVSRVQSFRRSIRESFRRRRGTVSVDNRKQIALSMNLDSATKLSSPAKKPAQGGRTRSSTEPASELSPARLAQSNGISSQVAPEMAGYVTNICFAETHVSGGGPHASVFASTMGSAVIRYSLSLPDPVERLAQINRAFLAGKEYFLLHAAPIVATFILDHEGIPLPDPYEVEARTIPMPDMRHPHFAVICSQEQIKIVTLPGMKQKRKQKVSVTIQERINRAWILRVKVAAAPVGVLRDWNPALAILSSAGSLLVYSLPDLSLCFKEDNFIPATDLKALQSVIMSPSGESLHLRSFSELERTLLCSYGFSYHTAMTPSLFPFEGSTLPVQAPKRNNSRQREQMVVEAEVAPQELREEQRHKSSSSVSEDHSVKERTPVTDDSVEVSSTGTREKLGDHEEASGTTKAASNGVALDLYDGHETRRSVRSKSKSKTPEKDVMSIPHNHKGKDSRRKSESSSSSDGSSDSDSSDDDDDDDLPSPKRGDAMTFGNTFALGLDDIGEGAKELDNIIASSLQQLESARAFYEQMQARVKKSE